MIYKYCTRKCTRNARFQADFGRFLCIFGNGNRVQQKTKWSPATNRASTLYPGDEPGLSQQCGCKGNGFFTKSCVFLQVSFLSNPRKASVSNITPRKVQQRQCKPNANWMMMVLWLPAFGCGFAALTTPHFHAFPRFPWILCFCRFVPHPFQ